MNERLSAGEKLDLSEDYYYCIMAAFQAISSESKRQFMDLVTASSTMEMFPIPKSFENPDEFFQVSVFWKNIYRPILKFITRNYLMVSPFVEWHAII